MSAESNTMDPLSSGKPLVERVTALEGIAEDVEKNLSTLRSLVAAPSSNTTEGKDELVRKLRQLLGLLKEDAVECEAIRAQRDELAKENERLRVQGKKYEYRIMHLLRTIEEIEQKNQKTDPK